MTTDLRTARDDFDKAIGNLLDMNTILREDMNALLCAFRDDQTKQALRRCFIRASWAYVEAITHALKHMTSILVDAGAYELDPEKAAFLKLERVQTLNNIKETIRLVSEVFDVPERDLGGGSGWCLVKPALKVRDRLVHPKSAGELRVEDAEWKALKGGFDWLVHAFDGLLTDITERHSHHPSKTD